MASKLKYPARVYQPTYGFLEEAFSSQKAMKEEYSRLRDIAQKRLTRLGTEGFKRSHTYRQNIDEFPKLSEFGKKGGDIEKKADFAAAMSKLARFIESPTSFVGTQRRIKGQTMTTLQGMGYEFITEENFWDFMDFMDEYREKKLDKIYDSDRVVNLFKDAQRRGIDPQKLFDDFDKYIKNRRALKELEPPKEKKGKNSEELKESLS